MSFDQFPNVDKRAKRIQDKENKRKAEEELEGVKQKRKKKREGKKEKFYNYD